jgi:glucosamine--fructose-6-phosphate aminotransferase (isomerizing)
MCGISAVYGQYAGVKAMLITLNQLERGTKGCGVAYMCNGGLTVLKEPIHPIEFFDRYFHSFAVETCMAIAHNRLPSAGGVCFENTHPFLSCDGFFALAHNGHAFVNHMSAYLVEMGHRVQGETDSEILTHLLEMYYEEQGDMLTALKCLVENHLSGAITVLTKKSEIYCAKSGAYPLYYALDDSEIYVASSERAIRELCKMLGKEDYVVVNVEDNEVIRIDHDGFIDHLKIAESRKKHRNVIRYDDWMDWYYTLQL